MVGSTLEAFPEPLSDYWAASIAFQNIYPHQE
jgi:hypothetical protein